MPKCTINRTTISNGIRNSVKKKMTDTNFFIEEEGNYTPKGEDYQEFIDEINNSFGEEIIMKFHEEELYTIVDPSDRLINQYLNTYKEEQNIPQEKTTVDITTNVSEDGEIFTFSLNRDGVDVGTVKAINDGEYLTVTDANITVPKEGIGSDAYPQMGNIANTSGLQFRSDSISNRLTKPAIALWEKLTRLGRATKIEDHYYYNPIPILEEQDENIPAVELTPEQNSQFQRLQDDGFISYESNIIGGKEYYKILKNEDVVNTVLKARGINFVNISDGIVELGIKQGELNNAAFEEDPVTRIASTTVTKKRVLNFLDNIGFRGIQTVNQLKYKGKPIPGTAYVDFANGVMQIVEGKEDYSLPEESMHILVELISESRPELLRVMMKDIINYNVYRELVRDPDYINNPLYQNENGTPNYEKLKREAVGKLLAEYLIGDLEETPRNTERAFTWWQSVIQWIREVFGDYKNPFQKALAELNQDDTTFGEFADISSDDIFLSAKSTSQIDQENPNNRDIWKNIKDKAKDLGITKIGSDYYKNGIKQENAGRVSNLVEAYYKKLFKNKNLDDSQADFYEQSRKDGDYIHQVMEEIVKSWIDPVNGLMKRSQSPITFPLPGNPIKGRMVQDLQKFIRNFMAAYPVGTRFIAEQVIYDSKADRYGTVDFQAIKPDGTVDIIDWKSMLLEDIEGAKDYKREGIYIQLNEYMRILKEEYGIEKPGKLRAMPIKKWYKTFTTGKVLMGINIGDADPSKITVEDRQLRPIISPEESTGSEEKDKIITKLEKLYKKYIEKGYFQKDRNILTDVQEAIYEIRISNSVDNLANYFEDLLTKFNQLLAEGKNLENGNKQDISEALAMITFYEDIMENVVTPSVKLQKDTSIDEASRAKLYAKNAKLNFIADELHTLRETLVNKQAEKAGIFGLLLPEKVVNLARRFFRSMGSQDIATVRYLYEIVKKAYNRIDIATDERLKELGNLKADFDKWQKSKGLNNRDAIGMLVDYKNGRIHSKIDKSFYEQRQQILEGKKKSEILEFVAKNYDLTEYKAWYTKALADNQKIWNNSTYDADPKINAKIRKARREVFEKNYDVFNHPVTAYGYHNTLIWGKNIKEDLWYSEKYKELIKPENKELLALYEFMIQRNKELAATGAIKDYEAYTFMPNVRKDFATILMAEDKNILQKGGQGVANWYNNFRGSMTVGDYELNYQGARDSFTGEKLNKRFVPFVSEIDPKDQSFDLFAIYGLMSKEIYKEQYLSENDEIIRSLLHIEKLKPNLLQNKYGVAPDGKPIIGDELGKNARILEEHIKAIVNGETLQYDADYVIKFKLRQGWNKSPLGRLYQFDINPETYKPTSISTTKFLLWLNTANQKRVLGINPSSALSNLFGGSFASSKLYQKYLSRQDLTSSWKKMTSGGFYQSDDMKKNAALVDYFLPLLNNREAFKSSQLSVSDSAAFLSQEWLMAPMRKTSEIVQLNVFLALIENTGLINGRIVNLREQAAIDTNYSNRYTSSTGGVATSTEIKAAEDKFEKRLKELKEQYKLTKTAQFKTIEEAGKKKVILDIPGIDRNHPDVANLREITQTMAKDSLGEADEFDVANYKYSIWWRLFMTFKNWIPRQADVRFGEFRYDQAHHAYEYGRFRMFARALMANFGQTAVKFIPIPYLTGAVTNAVFSKKALIERAKEVYSEKVKEATLMGRYNKDIFITEGEFIDRFIQGTDSTFAEIRTLIFMTSLLFMGLAAPDDDDDASDKAWKALTRKQINKLIDEVGFFYSPKSGIDIAGGGAPVFSIVRDAWNLGTDVGSEMFGFGLETIGFDEKGPDMQEKAKPIKRTFKMFPALNVILSYLPVFDEETAKEWGVRVQDRRAF